MIDDLALIVLGIALLVWSADRFTDGAAALANNFGVSPLIIGLTIVAIGSSAPEILVSITSAISGSPELAVGNALGSNIANIAFVVGLTALVKPLQVESNILRREFPILFLVSATAGILLFDGVLGKIDGIILLSGLVVYILWLVRTAKNTSPKEKDNIVEELIEELPDAMPNGKAVLYVITGGIVLAVSSRILVFSASNIALQLGVSELVVGLTVIALGTSLPELAASIAGVMKNEHEMAVGNVIGSNIFNLLAVLGIPGLFSVITLENSVFYRDYLLMLALTTALFFLAYGFNKPGRITRLEGSLLFMTYLAYTAYLVMLSIDQAQAPTQTAENCIMTLDQAHNV